MQGLEVAGAASRSPIPCRFCTDPWVLGHPTAQLSSSAKYGKMWKGRGSWRKFPHEGGARH